MCRIVVVATAVAFAAAAADAADVVVVDVHDIGGYGCSGNHPWKSGTTSDKGKKV